MLLDNFRFLSDDGGAIGGGTTISDPDCDPNGGNAGGEAGLIDSNTICEIAVFENLNGESLDAVVALMGADGTWAADLNFTGDAMIAGLCGHGGSSSYGLHPQQRDVEYQNHRQQAGLVPPEFLQK